MANQDNQFALPQEIYSAHLETINAVKLSKREIDIIACVLNGRSAKGIGHFLSLSPRTVEGHIHNAMKKLGCTSRESMIALLESTEQFLTLKSYYLSLLTYSAFEKSLKDIAKQETGTNANKSCLIVYWQDNNPAFFQNLKIHLSLAGIVASLELRQQRPSFSQLIQETHQDIYTIYVIPDSPESAVPAHPNKHDGAFQPSRQTTICTDKILFLLPKATTPEITFRDIANYPHINLPEQKNYYFLVFSILRKILPGLKLGKVSETFEGKHGTLHDSFDPTKIYPIGKAHAETGDQVATQMKNFWLKKKMGVSLLFFLAALFLLPVLLFTYQQLATDRNIAQADKNRHSSPDQARSVNQLVRSDLVIPAESLFLNRLVIIQKLDDQFKKQKEEVKTVALVGAGGAGKTTLARQYAHSQKQSAIIWELNAETTRSLKGSFEKMAYALSQGKEDDKVLAEFQKIAHLVEREDKILQFVKKHLSQRSGWVLIFDQIDHLADIQKYFPKDANIWGEGKVILTTRDLNIQNSKQVNAIVVIEELTPDQKLDLFTKIMSNGDSHSFSHAQQEEARKFLEEIPPFPLDVSIAAYYLRVTRTSYEKYLGHLNEYNQYVDLTQENILQEAGEYANTRYKIISLTLNRLVNLHPDYGSLLLMISLLDSQNIPRDLLDAYKDDAIVDTFIYNLKKHSLIINESSQLPNSIATFSIHQNTQNINRSYLFKVLSPQKNTYLLSSIANALENFVLGLIGREDILELHLLIKHCEKFLSHGNLLDEKITEPVSAALGYMYFHLGDYDKAQKIIKANLDISKRYEIKNNARIAKLLDYLGYIHRAKGDYKTSRSLLEESLNIYTTHFPEKYTEIVQVMVSLGKTYKELGNYGKAMELLEQSLAIHEKFPIKNPLSLARSLADLGNACRSAGNYEKATSFLDRSFRIYKSVSHGVHLSISQILMYLGLLEYDLGNIDKARGYLESSLRDYEKYFPEGHIYIARNLTHLGSVYRNLKNYKEAIKLLEKSLSIHKKHFPSDHVQLAWVLGILGKAYAGSGDYKKAHQLLEKSLTIYKGYYGPGHIKTAWVIKAIGEVYLLEKNKEAAEKFLNESARLFQQANHPMYYKYLESLAELFLEKSMNENNNQRAKVFKEQAMNLLRQALDIIKVHFPENSSHIARIQSKLED
jgi:tetratricopeptide (TPR) repeat protein/DNA-binding CsgD family transcriptional regulator